MAPSVSQLETIDTVTGKPTAVGNALPNEIDSQGLTTIDYMRKIFYLVRFDWWFFINICKIAWDDQSDATTLYGFSLDTGDVTVKVALPFAEGVFVGVGQALDVDPLSGDVFVVGRLPKSDDLHHVLR